jgi:hypothetical protein
MEHLRVLVQYFKDRDEDTNTGAKIHLPRASDEVFKHLEDTLLPHLMRVLQKDDTLIRDPEIVLFAGCSVGHLWEGGDSAWKKLHMALLYAVMNGNPKEKFGKILETVKGMLPGGGGAATDEISKILEDEDTQSSITEIMDLIMNTRLASLIGELVSSVSFEDLDLNFDDPEALLAMLKNPADHPVMKEMMDRAQQLLQEKIKTGKINQQQLVREIETIRAKCISSFGKYLNEMVVGGPGNTTGNSAAEIMSNSPEARRARMLARLQKKQRDKIRK